MADSKHAALCDTCLQRKKRLSALTLCKECRELYCMECSSMHAVVPVTEKHLLTKISNAKTDSKFKVNLLSPVCSACERLGKGIRQAGYLCNECRDMYCGTCKEHHMTLKATKHHTIYGIPIGSDKSTDTTGQQNLGKSIELASDFEGFNISPEDDPFDRAEAAVSMKKSRSQSLDVKILNKEDIDKVSAEFVTTFNAASMTDKAQYWFWGIVLLSKERIVLLDCMNHKLKLFGKDFKMLSAVKLPKYGFGLTRVTDDTVAVLFDDQILFYSIQQSSLVKESKSFKLKQKPNGDKRISYNGSVFVVLYGDMISVLSNDGDVLHEIENISKWSSYVYIDHETNDIYVSDSNKYVTCLSTDGKIKWQAKIDDCRDIITFYNCLLVAAETKLVLLTRDGKYQKTIFEDKDILTKVNRMGFDDKTHRLCITHWSRSMVTVLQLQY